MKIFFIDYAHYSFIEDSALNISTDKIKTCYLYSSSFPTPSQKGKLDDSHPSIIAIPIAGDYDKNSFVSRFFQEKKWGQDCCTILNKEQPDTIVVSNTPIEILFLIQRWCQKNNKKFILWMQDIHGIAIYNILSKKLGFIGKLIGKYFSYKEHKIIRKSHHIIAISPDHQPFLEKLGIKKTNISILPNWATLSKFPNIGQKNHWSTTHHLDETRNIIYSGTLGFKHNPGLFLSLAERLQYQPYNKVRIVIISEGVGATWLAQRAQQQGIKNLIVLPFQKQDVLAEALSSAEILTAILEPDAGSFSVPSKILTYLCIGRPILAAIPAENLSARIVATSNSGLITAPTNTEQFVEAAISMLDMPIDQLAVMGKNARQYAESNFSSQQINKKLLTILNTP